MASSADSFIGEIALYPYSFAPSGWVDCDGSLRPIQSGTPPQPDLLFAVIGNTYGGDGKTNFAVPDLRGRAVIGAGANPLLTQRSVGEPAGSDQVKLIDAHVGHIHVMRNKGAINPDTDKSSNPLPSSTLGSLTITRPGMTSVGEYGYSQGAQADKFMHQGMVGKTGGDQPHDNMQPYVALRYCICVEGVFPAT
jgi:microcystin-dependent protein